MLAAPQRAVVAAGVDLEDLGAVKVRTPYRYRCNDCANLRGCTLSCADDLALRIEMEGPDTVAAVFMEPVQNTGGAFTPPEGYWARVREICDHYGVLLVSDEVIAAFGRFGHMFGSLRYGYQPDLITFAKGVTSGYSPLGGMMISDRLAEPFLRDGNLFLQGQTFGAHPVSCAVANANLDLFEREDLCGHVLANETRFKSLVEGLLDIPIVGPETAEGKMYTRAEWIMHRASDISRAGVWDNGGITPVMKIAHLCESFRVQVEIHSPGAGNLHALCAMAWPGKYYERGLLHPFINYETPSAWLRSLDDPMDDHGYVHVSPRPGLGQDIDWDYIAAHEVKR